MSSTNQSPADFLLWALGGLVPPNVRNPEFGITVPFGTAWAYDLLLRLSAAPDVSIIAVAKFVQVVNEISSNELTHRMPTNDIIYIFSETLEYIYFYDENLEVGVFFGDDLTRSRIDLRDLQIRKALEEFLENIRHFTESEFASRYDRDYCLGLLKLAKVTLL